MTTYALFRLSLTTRAGNKVYAQAPGREGYPITWTGNPALADTWMHAGALEVHARLRRQNTYAHIEPYDEVHT